MTEDQMREAMLEDAKEVRKRAKDRDGTNIYFKQNLAIDYHMGGRDSKPETKEIIENLKIFLKRKVGHHIST